MLKGTIGAPYLKSLTRQLASKQFDADKALEELEGNPTLAAEIIKNSVKHFYK